MRLQGALTRMSVDPEYDRGGVCAEDALQRAHGDAVVAAKSDGYATSRGLSAHECETRDLRCVELHLITYKLRR